MPSSPSIPVLLLKTESAPTDSYARLFSTYEGEVTFTPQFVPVLAHAFNARGLQKVKALLEEPAAADGAGSGGSIGGLIFTSQRAVAAFASVVSTGLDQVARDRLACFPIYSVGPETTRALSVIPSIETTHIVGQQTGNGEALAHFILQDYPRWYPDERTRRTLVFPVGDQRRDIIPKTLMNPNLNDTKRVQVLEEVVYETTVMESFPEDFGRVLKETQSAPCRWVVVFSPSGCDHMLRGLGMIDEATGRVSQDLGERRTRIATIGPTTRSYLIENFGFEPDVSASKPSSDGILNAILTYPQNIPAT